MNLNDFLKFESFFKKSKKAAKNTGNNIQSVIIDKGVIKEITPSEKKGIFNGLLKSDNIEKKVRFYGKKFLYNNENEINISNVLLDKYNFIR